MADKTITLTLKTIADINDVTQRAKDIQAALDKIQLPQKLKTSLETTFNELYRDVEKASEAMKSGFKTKGDVTKYERSINNINSSLTKLYTNINNIDATKLEIKTDTKEFKDLERRINGIKENLRNINVNEVQKLQNLLKNPPSGAAAWSEFLEAISAAEPDFEAAEKALRKLSHQVANHQEQIEAGNDRWKQYSSTVKQMSEGLDAMRKNIADNAQELINLNKEQENLETKAFEEQAQEVDKAKNSMRELTTQTEEFGKAEIDAKRASQQLGSELDQFKSRITYFFGLNNAVRLFQRAVRSAVATIKDLDKVMTETAVVTDFSVADMWAQLPEYTERANKLGVTIHDVYEASTLYYQQGLKTNEVMAVTNATLKMARIASLDAAEATDRMTNALRGFNMEITETNADRVADVYSKLAAISASNVDEISTAMTKTASLASNANMKFETTAAFLAQIIETTRESAETAGTALKTVIARFSEVKQLFSQGELLGIDEEGEAIDVNKVSKALRTAGIDLNEYLTGVKGLDDIFIELASKWDSLDRVQQRYIATMAAGSRQQSRFIAMMQDYKRTTELVTAANNAAGASEQQYEKTLESLESKLNKLHNSWNTFLMSITNQGAVKFVVDALRTILDLINKITSALPGMLGSFAKIGVTLGGLKLGKTAFNSLFKQIGKSFSQNGYIVGQGFLKGFQAKINEKKLAPEIAKLTTEFTKLSKEKEFWLLGGAETTKYVTEVEEKLQIVEAKRLVTESAGLTTLEKSVLLNGSEASNKALNLIATKKLEDEETQLAITKAIENGVQVKGILGIIGETAQRVLLTLGIKAEETATYNLVSAKLVAKAATLGLNKAQLASLLIMGKFLIVVGLLVGAFLLIKNSTPEAKIEKLNKELEKNTTAASEAAEAYNNLSDSMNELNDKQKEIDSLTKGTKEWKDAVYEVNKQILELIDKYPELATFVDIASDGRMSFKEGYEKVLEDKQREANEANFTAAKTRVAINEQKNIQAKRNAENLLHAYAEVGGIPNKVIQTLLSSGKQAINKEDIKKALDEYNQEQGRYNLGYQNIEIQDWIQNSIITAVNQSLNTQRGNDATTKATNVGVLSTILSSKDYTDEEARRVTDFINNVDISKIQDLTELENLASTYITRANGHYDRLMSGEMTEEDIDWFEKNEKEIQEFVESIKGDFNSLAESVLGAKEVFDNLDASFAAIGLSGEGWWKDQGSATTSNILNKYEDLTTEQRDNLTKAITNLTKDMDTEDKNQFISQLFTGVNWESIDSLDKFGTQLETLGIEVKNTDLQKLIDQIILIKNATSSKAIAENLSSNINAQNEILNNINSNTALTNEQRQAAINAGATNDQFVLTAAGWVYTGDPNDLIQNFANVNANMYQNALTTYKNEPNETNRENVNQMAQIMGSSANSYMTQGMDVEALNNYTKGAEASLSLDEYGKKYIEKAKEIEKENKALADSYLRSANAATKLLPKFEDLTSVINDNAEALEKDDPDALAAVAKAASKAFGTNVTTDFIKKNKKEFIEFAKGTEDSFDKISDALIKDNKDAFNTLSEGMDNVKIQGENLSTYLQSLDWDAEGQATINDEDFIRKLGEDQTAAENLEKALKAAGIAMDFEWAEEEIEVPDTSVENFDTSRQLTKKIKIKVPKKVTLTNALKEQQTINSRSGGSKSSGGGGSSKQKYWDNPYDELYNLLEKQNEALRTREKLEREYDRILKDRSKSAKQLLQNSLDEITNLRKELGIQEQIQAGRIRMINELGSKSYRDSEGNSRSFNSWGASDYAHYDFERNVVVIDWNAIDRVNDPDKGGAIEAYISKLEELSSSFEETQDKIEEMRDIIAEIRERGMQEYLDFEQRALDAVIAREQKIIDDYSSLSDTINESNSNILSSLRESIDLERQIRDNTKTEEDIANKEARLAYLQRDTSGANQTEILKLQKELDQAKESYGDTLIDQAISNLEDENEKANQQREKQIEIMEAQLEWAKTTGEFWEEIYELIDGAFDEEGNVIENSPLANLIREAENYRSLSKYGKENFDIEYNKDAKLGGYEGRENWEHNGEGEDTAILPETTTSTTSTTPTTSEHGYLSSLDRNIYTWNTEDVKTLQKGLNDLIEDGYIDNAPLDVDGSYGNKTKAAVKSVQALVGARVDGWWGPQTYEKFLDQNFYGYKTGGLVTSTGPAWLDGTKSNPEMVLSAQDTENFIALRNALTQMVAQNGGKGGDNYFDIQINVDELGSDYDVDQLANKIKKQIYDDSSYRNVNAINYLR